LGHEALQADLPELPELDNLFAPEGVIGQAQALAAAAFGAEQSWFLANGSTCGLEAAVLATCNPGEKLILPRNAHQSVWSALVLSGALPIWIEPDFDPIWGIAHCLTAAKLQAALSAHPDAKAVLMVSPTYHGICGDLAAIADLTHQYGLPLLVDEAHGAHFAFHPDLPASALSLSADLTVQSIHKTLSALTQAAMLHVQGERIDRLRLSSALRLLQSTSPNYLLLASLDAARRQMALEGEALLGETLHRTAAAKQQIRQIPGLSLLEPDHSPGCRTIDPLRLTVGVDGLGMTGFAADEILHQKLRVTAELPALHSLTFIITPGNKADDLQQLVEALRSLAAESPATLASSSADLELPRSPVMTPVMISAPTLPVSMPVSVQLPMLSPRDAFFATATTLPIDQVIGQLSAELVCPYPPGIPILFPGEVITQEAIYSLRQILANGGILAGCADADLDSLSVISTQRPSL
jgi:arginine/lysine/ornithine decarboxylase